MTVLKRLVVVTGEYQAADGQTKKRYRTIGHLHEGQYGQYVTLDPITNLAAVPRKDGVDRVYANLYDPEERGQRNRPSDATGAPVSGSRGQGATEPPGSSQSAQRASQAFQAPGGGGLDEDVPFAPVCWWV